jgi:hypothetical protein
MGIFSAPMARSFSLSSLGCSSSGGMGGLLSHSIVRRPPALAMVVIVFAWTLFAMHWQSSHLHAQVAQLQHFKQEAMSYLEHRPEEQPRDLDLLVPAKLGAISPEALHDMEKRGENRGDRELFSERMFKSRVSPEGALGARQLQNQGRCEGWPANNTKRLLTGNDS